MSEELISGAPSLPAGVLYVTAALLTVLLLYVFWRTNDKTANFIVFAVWVRYMMSAFHSITYTASPLGLSWNALGSCFIFGLGILVIDRRMLRLKFFLPVYVLIAVIAMSGLVNRDISGTVNAIIKYGYLIVLACGTCEAMARYGEQKFLRVLLWAFVPLIVFQALSVGLDVSKATESDGSISYIGGYNHEAAFSIALATGFVIVAFANGLNFAVKSALLLVLLVGLLLANYRTAILAIVPILFAQFAMGTTGMFPRHQRPAVAVFMMLVGFTSIVTASFFMEDRFRDMAVVLNSGFDLIKPPVDFTRGDVLLLSGRLQIWSEYLYAYAAGSDLQKLLGFGANSWVDAFSNYAHNTLVSQLYEYGVLGVIALLYLWGAMLLAAIRTTHGPKAKLIAGHLSFILLTFATMPLWMIEGYIFYGLLCGYTLYLLKPVREAAAIRPRFVPAPQVRALPALELRQHASPR
jgi:hypothetical protein